MVPIITYHSVGDLNPVLDTPLEKFDAQLKAFAQHGYKSVSASHLVALIKQNEPLPEKTIVITFDDGYQSFYSQAWPALKRFGFGATVFLITDFCGKDNQWVGQPKSVPKAPLLTWSQIEELAQEGCEFGGHTKTHHPLSTLSPAAMLDELVQSKERIKKATGQSASIFAYPYGDASPEAIKVVQEHYEGAVSTNLGLVNARAPLYLLPRIDSYYLTESWISNFENPLFNQYLAFRQALRKVRRVFQPDWQPHEYQDVRSN